ncbi:beta-1,6-N-acetylglucosaminyltransferase [Ligilactobacillus agilis]|uniref:beta-1,6-N-acetylglucosaminyltransferase n=1 Tax=Ligilactobacillus agilis TaxID=1601 RepID=UPI003D80A376
MKHAIMVIGHGNNADILQATINHFDSDKIDFFVHWDKKWAQPTLCAKDSQIIMIENPLRVQWGTDSQIRVEKLLLEKVRTMDKKYDYVHLISANDLPLMTKDYFINYFTNSLYLGFVENVDLETRRRLSWWYPSNINYRSKNHIGTIVFKFVVLINKLFRIDRLSDYKDVVVEKGCN